MIGNNYAFDDCSILNMCEIEIPEAFRVIVGKNKLQSKGFAKLNSLINKLNELNIKKYKFVPTDVNDKIVKVAGDLIADAQISLHVFKGFGLTFKEKVIDQLEQFSIKIDEEFHCVEKDENISTIKTFFENNLESLKREKNMPEDDDLMIIAGYKKQSCDGKKYLISKDEHFWGYKDLILNEFSIKVVAEWNCDKLIT